MDSEYHPETDVTPLLSREDISKYRMLIGSVILYVTLGRYDVMYAVVTLSRYNMSPCTRNYKADLRIVNYFQYYKKSRLVFYNRKIYVVDVEDVEHNWTELYPYYD